MMSLIPINLGQMGKEERENWRIEWSSEMDTVNGYGTWYVVVGRSIINTPFV